MIATLRRLAPLLLLAPLLASCQPPGILARAVFIGDSLAFVAADSGDDGMRCWHEAAVVDDGLHPVWQFNGAIAADCRQTFPLYYGRAPGGAETSIEAHKLEPGRLYLLVGNAVAEISSAFAFTQVGDARIVHNIDPDSPVAQALLQRWRDRPMPGTPAPSPADGDR